MPTIFIEQGYRFFFYSNDHQPIHVHVRYGDDEATFDLADNAVELRDNYGMKRQELKRAEKLASANRKIIVEQWHEHFGK